MHKEDLIIPVGDRVIILKDEDADRTSGGIILPPDSKTPNITGIIIGISDKIANDISYLNIKKFCRVIYHPRRAIPVSFESDNRRFIVPLEDIVAIVNGDGKLKDNGISEEGMLVDA